MKNSNTILFLISCIVIIFMSFYFLNMSTKMKHIQDNLATLNANLQIKEEFYNFNFECNNTMFGKIISDILCTGRNNEKMRLSQLVKDKSLLIYRYQSMCSSCKQDYTELQVINEIHKAHDNVIILCSQHVFKDLLLYINANKLKVPIYVIPLAFDWILEEKDFSYYFVLHPDMKIFSIYVPNMDFPELNKQYLEGVKRFLSE